jgi:ornithine carbamoyltransferase
MPDLFDVDDLWPHSYARVLELALAEKVDRVLEGQGVALLFEKPSARTRNSSEMAVVDLGGHPVYIQGAEVGLDVRESAEDVARTLACYHRILCARVFDHDVLARMAFALEASNFDTPVINLLSDAAHPCQAIADMLTLRETIGAPNDGPLAADSLVGQVLAYIGDANNVCRSLVKAALIEGMDVRVASPVDYSFSAEELAHLTALNKKVGRGSTLVVTNDPVVAAGGADALYTDVWTSMGQEEEKAQRLADFAGFTIDDALLDVAEPDVVVLHCLPAHRGEEISASVFEGMHSVVWKQAAHRRTAMRGILAWALE